MSKLSKKDEKELELARNRVISVLTKNPIQAIEESKKYLHLAKIKQADYDSGMAYLLIGKSLLNLRRFELAGKNLTQGLKVFEKINDVDNKVNILIALGMVERNMGNLAKALRYYYQALEEPITKKVMLGNLYNNIAVVYEKQQDMGKALSYFNKGLKIIEKQKPLNLVNVGYTVVNIANIYRQTEEYEKAIKLFKKSLRIAVGNENNVLKVRAMRGLGAVYSSKKEYEKALEILREALLISRDIGTNTEIITISLEMIPSLKAQGAYKERKEILLYSTEIARKYQKPLLSYCLLALIDHYSDVEDYENAYKTQVEYSKLKEEEEKKQREEKLHELQVKFETSEKEKQIQILEKEKAFQAKLLEQAKQIEEQNHKLTEANQDLKQFNYAVSHDLKEPIRQIKNFARLLKNSAQDKLNNEEREMAEFIEDGVSRMSQMVEDLLKFATAGSENAEKTLVDLNEVVEIVKADLRLKIQENNATVQVTNKLPKLKAHKSQMVQLFMNLVNNAIKFKKPDVPPRITISAQEEPPNTTISIQDNGQGIPKGDQENVFKIFKRLGNAKAVEGSGIGLSICQKIVTKMKGHIALKSSEGKGTTFYIDIPSH